MFQWLRDLLKIYTWTEVWLVASVPIATTGLWFLLSFLLVIPNDAVRTVSIWLLISGLTLGAATIDALRKR